MREDKKRDYPHPLRISLIVVGTICAHSLPASPKTRPLRCASSPHKAKERLCGDPVLSKVRSIPLPPLAKAPFEPLLLLFPRKLKAAFAGTPPERLNGGPVWGAVTARRHCRQYVDCAAGPCESPADYSLISSRIVPPCRVVSQSQPPDRRTLFPNLGGNDQMVVKKP